MSVHRIDRQVIELHCGSEESLGMLRAELTHFILPGLEKAMGKLLDEVSVSAAAAGSGLDLQGGDWYRVDRLEVDLGELTVEEWKDSAEVMRRFEIEVREGMRGSLGEMGVSSGMLGVGGLAGGAVFRGSVSGDAVLGGSISEDAVAAGGEVFATGMEKKQTSLFSGGEGKFNVVPEAGGAGVLSAAGMEWEMVRAFLLSGQLPWWADIKALPDMDTLTRRLVTEIPGQVRTWMAEVQDVAVWQRVGGFSLETRKILMGLIGDTGLPDAAEVMEELKAFLAGSDAGEKRFELIRGVVPVRQAGFFRWMLREPVRALRLMVAGSEEFQKVLAELAEVRRRLVERPLLMAMLLLYMPDEVMKSAVRKILGGGVAGGSGSGVPEVGVVGEDEIVREEGVAGVYGVAGDDGVVGEDSMVGDDGVVGEDGIAGADAVVGTGEDGVVRMGEGRVAEGDLARAAGGVAAAVEGKVSGVDAEELGDVKKVSAGGGEVSGVDGKVSGVDGKVLAGAEALGGGQAFGGEMLEGRETFGGGVLAGGGVPAEGDKVAGESAGVAGRIEGGMGNAGPVAVNSRQRWFKLKTAERRILEEIVKKRSGVAVGEQKLLMKLAKRIPAEDMVVLRRLVDLPEEKLQGLLSTGLPVTTIGKEEGGQRVLVENSGLCLFAPYLASFFGRLGYIRQERWCDEQAAGRAVHLLQYVATGRREAPEYLLPLNKILCGLLPEDVVTTPVRLTKKEMTEGRRLAEAVVANWSALKNTSVNGLRGSFICRQGIITDGGTRWVLQVERKEYDLLLNGLPWGYSFIKLPWMVKHLEVEW